MNEEEKKYLYMIKEYIGKVNLETLAILNGIVAQEIIKKTRPVGSEAQ